MNWPPLTRADCEQRMTACREALLVAVEEGDTLTADAMADTIDELLDRWAHIPKPRTG